MNVVPFCYFHEQPEDVRIKGGIRSCFQVLILYIHSLESLS